MFQGCPLCNGIETPGFCPNCGTQLEDLGMIENFFGPYSPYENYDNKTCVHLIHCTNCHYDFHQEVNIP